MKEVKVCLRCKKTKNIDLFYKDAKGKNGISSQCKECRLEKWRLNKEIIYAKRRVRHAFRNREYRKKWIIKNHHKWLAHKRVESALKSGVLVKKSCEVCGEIKSHAHHENYLKPLAVVWLCALHHRKRHLELNEKRN